MDENQPPPLTISAISDRSRWVGRTAELGVLEDLLTSLRHGEGGCVLIEGPPGIGKSALVSQAVQRFGAAEVLLLRGSADEFCVSLPFQLITEALRPVRAVETPPEGGSLWGASARDPLAAGVQEALARVERACAVQPVVLVASDLQWVDEASLAVLGGLARLTAQVPLLLVAEVTTGSTRDEVHQLRRAILSRRAQQIALGPLNQEETARLTEGLLGVAAGDELRALTAKCGGNPLYVREMTAAMVRERRIVVRHGSAHLVRGAEAEERLPGSLGEVIADRIGHMAQDTLEVLRAASMLGTTFEPGELAAVLGWSVARVITALDEAAATGALRDTGAAAEFHAPLLRQALYESMPTPVRAMRHRHTAQMLSEDGRPAERVAAHLFLAQGVQDEWTLSWLADSGTSLLCKAPELARELLQRAVASLGKSDKRRDPLEAVLVMAAFLRGRHQECEALATRVLAGTKEPAQAAEMTWILAYSLLQQARPGEALDLVTDAPRRWELPPLWEARLCALHGVLLVTLPGEVGGDSVMPILHKAMESGRALRDAQTIAYAANSLKVACLRADMLDEGRRYLEEGIAAAEGDPQLTDVHLLLLANSLDLFRQVDLLDRARESARKARKLAAEAGTARLGMVLVATANFSYIVGAHDEALADLELSEELSEAPYVTVIRHSMTAMLKIRRGQLAEAAAHLEAIGQDEMAPNVRAVSGILMYARLAIAEAEGRQDDARAILRRILSDEFLLTCDDAFRPLPLAARTARGLEDSALAAEVLAAVSRVHERDTREVVRATARQCQGLLTSDPGPLREALTFFRTVSRVVEATVCAEDLSVVLAETGDTAEARAAMREAVQGYLQLGATGDLERADARWRAVGLRRRVMGARKRPADGWEALTPTELRIAELVAEGLSNPDIGERLYSSRRTVQTHVTHILAKLGLRSRNEVARAMAARSRPRAVS
ncbi:AAA family ATPase [Streptomyces sp. NPDC020681]|uniref:helix-turn-helix transcriptional regulator n=1 Tax=Streptomyces sp. NPDC020681 TaxID=3365083 RepID=UPI0037A17642